MPEPRFGHQPIREAVWRAGYTHGEFADLLGVYPKTHVQSAMYGICPPSPKMRRASVQLLKMPLESLFTEDALAAIYHPRRRLPARNGRARDAAAPGAR